MSSRTISRAKGWIVALACGVVLLAGCALWAVLVESVGTNVCSLPHVPRRAGLVRCNHHRHPLRRRASAHLGGAVDEVPLWVR